MQYKHRVVFVTPVVHHYRQRFHELMRAKLRAAGVRYDVVCGKPEEAELRKGDLVELEWATRVPQLRIRLRNTLFSYHPIFAATGGADLVIIMQENKHIQNYLLQLSPKKFRPKIGMMGHGRNFQSRKPHSLSEKWKRRWATKVDWWFGYTDETRRHIEALGFPKDKITIFNNSVDTADLRRLIDSVESSKLKALREELQLVGTNVGVFVGALYADKRLTFLVEAADRIREKITDFELIIVGGGPDLSAVQAMARLRPWMRVMGPRFDREKVEIMLLGHIFMMPGLMGLAILDAGVARLPVATTAFPWHSPEIAYLETGENGIIVEQWESSMAYGDAVIVLLQDADRRQAMGVAARVIADRYSIEAMADRFAQGVLEALAL